MHSESESNESESIMSRHDKHDSEKKSNIDFEDEHSLEKHSYENQYFPYMDNLLGRGRGRKMVRRQKDSEESKAPRRTSKNKGRKPLRYREMK